MASDETAEAILVAHQRQRGGCLCGWSELGKSHPAHQVTMLREAGLLAELLDPAFVRQAEYVGRRRVTEWQPIQEGADRG